MTLNPYESPQTIDPRPPVAEEVIVTTIDFAALAEAAEGCARAGKYYAIAFGLIGLEILGATLMPLELIKSPWVLLIFAPFLVSLGVLGVGVFWNTIACWQFKLELPDPKLRRLYSRCMNASWIKFALCISMMFIRTPRIYGGHGYVYAVTLWELLWLYLPAFMLLINSVVTVVFHFRGINELGELIHTKTADKLATLYLFSGVPATFFTACMFLMLLGNARNFSPPVYLLMLAPLLLLPMFVAYHLAYRRLGAAFRATAGKP